MRDLKNIVTTILKNDAKARNSDNFLYIRVIEEIQKGSSKAPLREVLLDIKFPPFESVSRFRRKAQEQNGSLKAGEVVTKARRKKEQEFRRIFKKRK